MLGQILEEGKHLTHPVLVSLTGATSWGELVEQAAAFRQQYASLSERRVGLRFQATAACLAALAAFDALRADVFLLPGDQPLAESLRLAQQLNFAAVVGGAEEPGGLTVHAIAGEIPGSGQSTVTILTSGTSGTPKLVRHLWASLARPVRRAERPDDPRWLLTYRPNLYAGLQVILQCLRNSGTLVAPPPGTPAREVADLAVRAGVRYASATPSWWRWLMMFAGAEALGRWQLTQVTLGGEVVDQGVLDALRHCFPSGRLVHIYATTELGRCFSVTDGRAGFPAGFLQGLSPDGIAMTIEDGELLVRSANAMCGYDQQISPSPAADWFHTGDLVECRGDRVLFLGRKSDMINVGGNKVQPLTVERVIRAVPGVADVRVYGKASSIVGQLVACEITPVPGADPTQVEEAVQAHCQAELAPHQRPRLITFVDQIALSEAGKMKRR